MTHRIAIRGYRVKDGRLVKCSKHKDVSARLRERGSKKVKYLGREIGSFRAPEKRPSSKSEQG